MKKNSRTIIFIPGFKGSTLVNQEEILVWPNFLKAQFNRTLSLSNDLPALNITNSMHYKSTNIVESVAIPGLIKFDIYSNFINTLRKNLSPSTELVLFHYDWRQDLVVTISKLKTVIDHIVKDKHNQIDIVCHSMGGLIASHVLQILETEQIRRVFFVAVPFQGALTSLLNLMHGSPFGLNKTLLSPKAMATFPSLYALLPKYPEAVLGYNLFDIETWKKFKLGYLTKQGNEAQLKWLKIQLEAGNQRYKKLELMENNVYKKIKLFFINNLTHLTPTKIQLGPQVRIQSGEGDGSVPSQSLQVPDYFKSFNYKTYFIKKSHAVSFTNDELLKIILMNLEQ